MRRLAVVIAVALAGCAYAQPELKAGVARVEITPSVFMPMYGYANRKCGPANGTHDPLFAKALVIQAGDARLAIVTMDIGSMVSDNLRRDVAAKLNIPVLLLSASHTHSGPAFLPYGSSPSSGAAADAYLAELERKVFGAVQEAAGAMFPARLAAGRGSLQLGYNRLLRREDGRARALFDNLERVPYGPVDPEFVIAEGRCYGWDPACSTRALCDTRGGARTYELQVLGGLSRRDAGSGGAGDEGDPGDVCPGRRGRYQPAVHGTFRR